MTKLRLWRRGLSRWARCNHKGPYKEGQEGAGRRDQTCQVLALKVEERPWAKDAGGLWKLEGAGK